jgi:hypothetical protein
MGFPVSAEGMHAGPEEKCKKQDITVAARRSFQREPASGSSRDLQGKQKKTHPACERAFCSSGMEGAADIKVSARTLSGILRDPDHPP